MTVTTERPWDWRRGYGFYPGILRGLTGDEFHAYDVNDNAACEPSLGLVSSRDQPNEGSDFCDRCVDVVKATPAGRDWLPPPPADWPTWLPRQSPGVVPDLP